MTDIQLKLEAVKLLKEWSTWMAAINTAAIFAISAEFVAKASHKSRLLTWSVWLFFGSVLVSASVLGELPAIVEKLGATDANVHSMHTYEDTIFGTGISGPPLWILAVAQHLFFLLALLLFVLFLRKNIWGNPR